MFNKPKKKVPKSKEEDKERKKALFKAKAKKDRFEKKVDKKSKYATSFRKPKVTITFDLDARSEFLNGFHKRKLERKEYHKAKLKKQLATEKQKIKAQAKKSIAGVSSSHSILPEVEAIIGMTNAELKLEDEAQTTTQSYVMGSKTVTISSLDNIHTKLPDMSESDSEEEENPNEDSDDGVKPLQNPGGANIKNLLKKTTNSLLVNSKAYKANQRLKQKSKRSHGKNRKIRERKREREGASGKKEPSSGPSRVQTGPNKSRKGKCKVKKGKGKKGK